MRVFTSIVIAYLVANVAFGPRAFAQPPASAPAGDKKKAPKPPVVKPTAAKKAPAKKAPTAAVAPPAPGVVTVETGGEPPGEKEFNSCKKLPSGKAILKLNLKPDSEVSDLIGWFSSITCTPFLTSTSVSLQGKKVTVIAPLPITIADAYRLFYAALESVNLTVEPSGKFLRVVDSTRAKFTKLPVYLDGEPVPSDKRFVTKLIKVENIDSNELNNTVLMRVKGESGDIVAYRYTLVITDTAENIQRMEKIIKEFDVPAAHPRERIWVIGVKNMSATDMAQRVAEIVPVAQLGTGGVRRGPGAPGAPAAPAAPAAQKWPLPGDVAVETAISKIVPDERSNTLIVIAHERAYEWLLTIIRRLDQPIGDGGDGKVHVYYCEHANCDELAATLSAVVGVQVSGNLGARRARTATAGQPAAPMPAPMGAPGQAQQGGPLLFEGDVRITFDPPTNALLAVSSFKDFQALRKVIAKLDSPRKQVFVEALILEVLLDKSRDVGVAYHGGKPIDFPNGEKSLLLGGFEASKTLSPTAIIGDLGGLTGALFGPTIPAQNLQIFGTAVQLPSFGVFLKLLQTNNDVNVLSNPHLLITNNTEGEISVGENLPFPGQLLGGFGGLGAQAGAGGLGGLLPSVGVQRQDVALKMKLLPSVNEHNMIRLDVDQEISDVVSQNYNGLGPATSKRSAKTTVVARDQQTVVIGGLMTDRTTESVKKVPILGDIPVIGFFFRSTSKSMKKANIIIALTPYVINDLSDLRRVAEKKMKERREFIDRYSSLEDTAQFEADIDYRRKRGMLEEINRMAREIEDEETELRHLREREVIESIPLEPVRGAARGVRASDTKMVPPVTLPPAPPPVPEIPQPLQGAPPVPAAPTGEGAVVLPPPGTPPPLVAPAPVQ